MLIALLGETAGHVADVLAALGVDRKQARQRAIVLVATAASGAGVGDRNPIDLPTATDMIVMTRRRDPREPGETHKHRLGDGLVHVDYGEPDQVFFLAHVIRVPRVSLQDEPRPLGVLDAGVEVWLTGVRLDDFVTVTLDGRSVAADAALQTYQAQRASREKAMKAQPDDRPPAWPAAHLQAVSLTLSDDLDTAYWIDSGQTGGAGREWRSAWQYRPTPPSKATTLHLVAQVASSVTTLALSLPASTR